jgi:hypothetical protein
LSTLPQLPPSSEPVCITRLWSAKVLQRIPIVQATGTVSGLPFYFRAYGKAWSFCLAPTPDDDPIILSGCHAGLIFTVNPPGYYETQAYDDAGCMSLDQAQTLIQHAAHNYLRATLEENVGKESVE